MVPAPLMVALLFRMSVSPPTLKLASLPSRVMTPPLEKMRRTLSVLPLAMRIHPPTLLVLKLAKTRGIGGAVGEDQGVAAVGDAAVCAAGGICCFCECFYRNGHRPRL